MGANLKNMASSFVIMALLVSLMVSTYNEFESNYDIVRDDEIDGNNIMEKLDNINLLQGINDITTGIKRLENTQISVLAVNDILGGLAIAATGILKTLGGLITFVFEIFGIITSFYVIPPIVSTVVGGLVALSIAFVLVAAYLRYDIGS